MALAVLLGVLLLAVLGAFGYVQTRVGQTQLADLAARLLSTPDRQVEVTGLNGFLPFDIRLASVRLRDGQGAWLEVDDARLQVTAGALLRGELLVRQAGARRVALNRLPPSPPPP